MVFETRPGVSGKSLGGSDTLWGQVGERGIVSLAIVHENLALATNAKVLLSPLSRVVHGDERDVGVCESLGGFPIELCMSDGLFV